MRLSLYEFETGAETFGPHRVVYDVANDVAFFGEAHVEGHALVWQLDDTPEEAEGALVSRRIQLDAFAEWVVLPPGGETIQTVAIFSSSYCASPALSSIPYMSARLCSDAG